MDKQPVLAWPERPTCHGEKCNYTGQPIAWRAPRVDQRDSPYGETFRTCSYCGSIHPEDLYNALLSGVASLGGSDWKYGWPHKFYVYGIPNPKQGQEYPQYSYGTPREGETGWEQYQSGYNQHDGSPCMQWRRLNYMSKCPPTVHAKWYNDHMLDLPTDAFTVMAEVLHVGSRILFTRKEGRLHYSAPYGGFQASGVK